MLIVCSWIPLSSFLFLFMLRFCIFMREHCLPSCRDISICFIVSYIYIHMKSKQLGEKKMVSEVDKDLITGFGCLREKNRGALSSCFSSNVGNFKLVATTTTTTKTRAVWCWLLMLVADVGQNPCILFRYRGKVQKRKYLT